MVPRLRVWQDIEGFLGEDTIEVPKVSWHTLSGIRGVGEGATWLGISFESLGKSLGDRRSGLDVSRWPV